jgi:hypothetical protein
MALVPGDVRWRRICPGVIEYLYDADPVRNERDDAHLAAADRAQQREHFMDTGDQHGPQWPPRCNTLTHVVEFSIRTWVLPPL